MTEKFKDYLKSIVVGGGLILSVASLEAIARDQGYVKKISKKAVKYANPYNASPFGELLGSIRYKCGDCVYYKHDEGKCRIIAGIIEKEAGCIRWIGIRAERNQ